MRLNEFKLSSSERAVLRAIDPERMMRATQEALDIGDASPLSGLLRLREAGQYVGAQLLDFEDHLRKMVGSRSIAQREQASERAMMARWRLTNAVALMQERADAEEREEQAFYVEQPLEAMKPEFPVRVALSFRWHESASGQWRRGRITYAYSPSGAPTAGGRRSIAGLTRRGIAAAEAERSITRSAIQSIEEYLREKRTGDGIPAEFVIRDEILTNYSTRLLHSDGGGRTKSP
jgi:hypothetical protein